MTWKNNFYMKEIIDKITSYNLFNYLLPGIIFVITLDKTTPYSFVQNDIIISVFVYYFTGLIISRLGSLIIEPVLKKISFLRFADYKDFVSASKKDSKIDILSEENNMYRTLCATFVLILLFKVYQHFNNKFIWLNEYNSYILLLLLLVLFIFSYRKQTTYIKKKIQSTLSQDK